MLKKPWTVRYRYTVLIRAFLFTKFLSKWIIGYWKLSTSNHKPVYLFSATNQSAFTPTEILKNNNTVGGSNFVPCSYRTVPNRTEEFFVFRTVIIFFKSVYPTVPQFIQNFKSANRTVKSAFVFPFFYKKREAYHIKK